MPIRKENLRCDDNLSALQIIVASETASKDGHYTDSPTHKTVYVRSSLAQLW